KRLRPAHASRAAGRSAGLRSKNDTGPSPRFAPAVAPIALNVGRAPGKARTAFASAPCDLFLALRGSRSLGGRARLLVAVTAHGVDVLDAHIAASIRAGSAVPLPRCLRSVPLGHVTGVDVRIDVGLGIGRRHADDHRQSAQPTEQSMLHHFTSLWARKCHTFYW